MSAAVACETFDIYDETVEVFLSLAYGSLSITLYVHLIRLIVNNPIFHHPFFFQFILLSVSNIILWTSLFITTRIIPNPIFCSFFYANFQEPTLFLKPLILGYYIPLAVQIFTVIVLSVNRMTVVLYPFAATKFWSKYTQQTLISIILTAFLVSFYIYDWGAFVQVGINAQLFLNYAEGWPHIPFVLMSAVLSSICLIIIFLTSTVTLIKIYNYSNTIKKTDVNLFWTSFGFSLTTLVVLVYAAMCKVICIILAFFCPPLAVIFDQGCTCAVCLNLFLTALLWIPGVIHAIYVISTYDNKNQTTVIVNK